MVKAIISDADGTLVNTTYLIRHGQYETAVVYLTQRGIPRHDIPDYETYESYINESGECKYLSSYFTDPDRSAFFIYADDKIAGFVLINVHTLIEERAHSIAEFYVVPNFRRQGIGERAAELAFRQFPGKWEVAQMEANQSALRFWRKVISSVTKGQYEETILDSEIWHGPVQTFDIDQHRGYSLNDSHKILPSQPKLTKLAAMKKKSHPS